jgi:hypothetical protein
MNKKRRSLLGFLSLLPISSVAFAQEINSAMDSILPGSTYQDYESEMIRRFLEGTLSPKYYDFLDRHGIPSIESLRDPQYSRHLARLVKEFIADLIPNSNDVQSLSAGTLSFVPPN